MKIYRLSILITALALLFFTFANQWLPVTDPVESNYALTAKEMVLSGDWLSPQIYHQYWFDKPIMIYWLIALSYALMGISDFAARFPSALFSAMSIGLLYQFVRLISGRKLIALWSALILATSLEFWVIAHGIVTDAVLLWATIGTMGAAYLGLEQNKKKFIALAYAFAGIAVLTKGPVGIVLPGLLLLLFAIAVGPKTYLPRLFPWQGLCAFAVVAFPWYIYMYMTHGQAFIEGFLGLHNYVRATVSEHAEYNKWYYYLAVLPLALLPWSGVSFYEMWKGRSRHFFYLYLMIWGWGTILFYSLMATKYPTYTFIALIPFSVMGALGTIRLLHHKRCFSWTILTLPAVLSWLVLVGATFFVKWGFWLLLYVVAAFALIVTFYLQYTRKKYSLPAVIALSTILLTSIVIYEGLVPLTNQRSSVSIATTIKEFPGKVYIFGDYKTSLVYYAERDIPRIKYVVAGMQTNAWAGKYTMPQVEEAKVIEELQQGKDILIVSTDKHIREIEQSGFYSLVKPVVMSPDSKFVLYRTRS